MQASAAAWRRIVCGRNMLIASIVAIVFLTAINYYGTMPIKAMYVVLPVLAVYYLVYHSYAPEFFLIAVDTGVGVAAMLVIHRALVSAKSYVDVHRGGSRYAVWR